MSLATKDIPGAEVGSKTLGMFHQKDRKDFRDTNRVNDINGTNVGSLLKGPATTRDTNPLVPEYNAPGDKEYRGTIRHAMDRLGENEPPKKARTSAKEPF